jgi:hypothetical protein
MKMVKRYKIVTASLEIPDGGYVLYSDYEALREALRKALDGWAIADHMDMDTAFIKPLRKQFLDI